MGAKIIMDEVSIRPVPSISYYQAILETAKLAAPHIGAQIITMGGNFVGVIFIAKLGSQELAASNLAYSIQNWVMTTVTSSISAGTNFAAKKLGEGKELQLGGVLQKSWLVSAGISVPIIGCLLASQPILILLHQDPAVVALTAKYFNGFAWGLPAMFMLTSNRQVALAAKNPKVGLGFVAFYQALDTVLSFCLVFGKAYLPKLGFSGLSYSNSISAWVTVLLFSAYMAIAPSFRPYGITKVQTENFWSDLWEIAKSGLSMGSKVIVELGTMVGASLMIGAMGSNQQAAQEAAFQYIFIINPLMFGMMDVTSKRVAEAWGTKHVSNVRKYGNAGILLGVFSSIICLIFFVAMPNILLRAFIDNNNANGKEILETARILLVVNGICQIADSLRTILLGALNGIEDRIIPTLYIIATLIAIFMPLGYVMGFPLHMLAIGIMAARNISIGLGAIMLSCRWLTRTAKIYEPYQKENVEVINTDIATEETHLLVGRKSNSSCFSTWVNYFRTASNNQRSIEGINNSSQNSMNYIGTSTCTIL